MTPGDSVRAHGTGRARGISAFADAPAARRICEHLRLPWQKVRELAFMAGHAQRVALGHALGDAEADWLTDEYCSFALILIARRERQHDAHSRPIPSRAPGGAPRRPQSAEHCPADPLRPPNRSRSTGELGRSPCSGRLGSSAWPWWSARTRRPGADRRCPRPLLRASWDEPTLGQLVQFARANRIPFPRRERGRLARYLKEWKGWRAARGLDVPDGPPPKCERPDYSFNVGAAVPGRSARRAHGRTTTNSGVGGAVSRRAAAPRSRFAASVRCVGSPAGWRSLGIGP